MCQFFQAAKCCRLTRLGRNASPVSVNLTNAHSAHKENIFVSVSVFINIFVSVFLLCPLRMKCDCNAKSKRIEIKHLKALWCTSSYYIVLPILKD